MEEYRTRIYDKYATVFCNNVDRFNEEKSHNWGRAYQYYFRNWLPKDKDATMVDVACGSGRLLHFFKTRNYVNVSGIDISPEQVRLAEQVCPTVCKGNALDYLVMHNNEFDLIVGLDIVEHFRKNEVLTFLDICLAALKPGGRIILQTPNADSPWFATLRYGDYTHEVCFSPNGLRSVLQLSGYKEIAIREQGPVPVGYSLSSTIRFALWKILRLLIKSWNLIETGNPGSGVFSRVFLITAKKPSI